MDRLLTPALLLSRDIPLILAAVGVLLVWVWVVYGQRAFTEYRSRPAVPKSAFDALALAHGLSPDDLRFLKLVRTRHPGGDAALVFVDPTLLAGWLGESSEHGVAARRLLIRLYGPAVARTVEEGSRSRPE